MNKNINRIIVLLITVFNLYLIYFSSIKEFELMIPTSAILVVSIIILFRVFFQFDEGKTELGTKHKENTINILIVILTFAPILLLTRQLVTDRGYIATFFIVMISVVVLLVVYFVIAYFTVYAKSTGDGIEVGYYIVQKREIKYQNIEKIWINKIANAIVIRDKDGTKIYIDMMLFDLHILLNELYHKADMELTEEFFEGIGKFYKGILLESNLSKLDVFNK